MSQFYMSTAGGSSPDGQQFSKCQQCNNVCIKDKSKICIYCEFSNLADEMGIETMDVINCLSELVEEERNQKEKDEQN